MIYDDIYPMINDIYIYIHKLVYNHLFIHIIYIYILPLSLHRHLQEPGQTLKASQAQWQEGAGQPASVVASCFIAPLHAMGNNETSATIRHKWNGSKNIGVSLRRASTWVCSGLVWNRRTRRWKVLRHNHSLLRRLWNKAAKPLPQYDCLRHPLTRSSSKKQRSRGWVTSQTRTCCPWKLPWRHRRVHMYLSPGNGNMFAWESGTGGTPLCRSQLVSKSFHWLRSSATCNSKPWCCKYRITLRWPLLSGPVLLRLWPEEGLKSRSTERVNEDGGMRRTCPIHCQTMRTSKVSQSSL